MAGPFWWTIDRSCWIVPPSNCFQARIDRIDGRLGALFRAPDRARRVAIRVVEREAARLMERPIGGSDRPMAGGRAPACPSPCRPPPGVWPGDRRAIPHRAPGSSVPARLAHPPPRSAGSAPRPARPDRLGHARRCLPANAELLFRLEAAIHGLPRPGLATAAEPVALAPYESRAGRGRESRGRDRPRPLGRARHTDRRAGLAARLRRAARGSRSARRPVRPPGTGGGPARTGRRPGGGGPPRRGIPPP